MFKEIIQFDKPIFEIFKTNYRQEQQNTLMKVLNILSFDTNTYEMLIPITEWKKFEILLCDNGDCRSTAFHPIQKGDLLTYHREMYGESYSWSGIDSLLNDPDWLENMKRLCDIGVNQSLRNTSILPAAPHQIIPAIYPKHSGKVLDLLVPFTQKEIDILKPYEKIKQIELEFKYLVKSLGIEDKIQKTLFRNY